MAFFLKQYRWWLAIVPALIAVSLVVYRVWLYPCSAGDAIPETTALVFRWESGKNTFSALDSTALPSLLQAFPELAADYGVFNAFLQTEEGIPAEKCLLMVQNLGDGKLALAASLVAPAFPWEERLSQCQSIASSFRGHTVYHITLPGGRKLAAAQYRNLLLLGRLPLQVESGIARLKGGRSGVEMPNTGEGLMAFLQTDNLLSLGTGLVTPESRQALALLEHWCHGIELEFQTSKDTLSISGRLAMGPESGRPFSIPAPARGEAVLSYLPGSLAWCFRKALPDVPAGKAPALFKQYIQPWLGGEMAWLSMGLPGRPADSRIALLAVNRPEDAERSVAALADEVGTLEAYDYQSFQIRQLLGGPLLGPLGIKVQNPYMVLLGDYLAVGSSRIAIEQLVSNLVVNNTLGQDEHFLAWYAGQDAGSKAWLYARPGLCASSLPAYFHGQQEPLQALLSAYDIFLLAFSPSGAFTGLAVQAGTTAAARPEVMLAWKAALDAPAKGSVQAFPIDETGPGYLVQDESNALYLLGANGERRQKYQFDGPILGAVNLIDYFGGEWRDLAFATPGGIHVVSAEGEAHGYFRIPLESPAISPLLVADFEGQGRYSFFVACANGYLFGWDAEGHPLPGWNPQALADSSVHQPMAHFQYRNKDYILALSDAGTLYAFQRDGSFRFAPVKMGANFVSPVYYQAESDIGRIALGDTDGFAHIVNLEGAYFRLRMLPNPGHGARFLFGALAGDERKDYLCYRGAEMRAYYYEGDTFKPFFNLNLPSPPDTAFLVARPGDSWIGLLNRKAGKIGMLDNTGQQLQGFPLAGSTAFVLTPLQAGGHLVVAGYGPSVYAYRLAY